MGRPVGVLLVHIGVARVFSGRMQVLTNGNACGTADACGSRSSIGNRCSDSKKHQSAQEAEDMAEENHGCFFAYYP